MSAMYDLVWASLEIWHGMTDGDCGVARAFIVKRLDAGDAEARRACVEFADACFIANIPFDLDYDLD